MSERVYRVLVTTGRTRVEGSVTIHEHEWVECSERAAMRYALGDPGWRDSDTQGVQPA